MLIGYLLGRYSLCISTRTPGIGAGALWMFYFDGQCRRRACIEATIRTGLAIDIDTAADTSGFDHA
jgi:hypothetical protein